MKKINIGILASVDSGKTTLSESMLYISGSIKQRGKVDNKDTVLDNYEVERNRGITVFSKICELTYNDNLVTIIDTPGHVDFTVETEYVLNVLDACILLIDATSFVTGQTKTLWDILDKMDIPVFLFVNKIDLDTANKEMVLKSITTNLTNDYVDFSEDYMENAAMHDEQLIEKYLEAGSLAEEDIQILINERKIYPLFFGSAARDQGVRELLDAITKYTIMKTYGDIFGAYVYKISRDGNDRLSNMLITGGTLNVKDICNGDKIEEIRKYNGGKYTNVLSANAGEIVSVVGLKKTKAGQGIGDNMDMYVPLSVSVISYGVTIVGKENINEAFNELKIIEEENPGSEFYRNEKSGEINAKFLGKIQMEVIKDIVKERFGFDIEFGNEEIIYKETITDIAMGVGHFEPLRHYAEVMIAITPLERGSGIIINNFANREKLPINYQSLIHTNLGEKSHSGVLTGNEITDVAINLLDGRAHLKHTEGGDFREASYRAVRCALMNAKSRLLEPYYDFTISVSRDNVGKVMSDVDRLYGTCDIEDESGDNVIIKGRGPAATFRNYYNDLIAFTHGKGQITMTFSGYDYCHNEEEVIKSINYNPDEDIDNLSGSVFCSHGSGFYVTWEEALEKMHLPKDAYNSFKNLYYKSLGKDNIIREEAVSIEKEALDIKRDVFSQEKDEEKQLAEIFAKTFGMGNVDENIFHTRQNNNQVKGKLNSRRMTTVNGRVRKNISYKYNPVKREKTMVVLDGYNIIFAIDHLKDLAKDNIDSARDKLIDDVVKMNSLNDYEIILVFDAYKVKGGNNHEEETGGIKIVYTKEDETADTYIEQLANKYGRKRDVRVITSDGLIRLTAASFGCHISSSKDFEKELLICEKSIENKIEKMDKSEKSYLFDGLDEATKKILDDIK